MVKLSNDIPALTGLRGLAAWHVVLYHVHESSSLFVPRFVAYFIERGFLAVDLFFILSGLVIHRAYGSTFQPFHTAVYFSFVFRRLARIYPLHLFFLLAYVIVPVAILTLSSARNLDSRFGLLYFVQSLFLIQNWGFSNNLDWNFPAWSISVEFFAYIIFPILAIFISATSKRNLFALPLLILIACGALSFIFFFSSRTSLGDDIPSFGLVRCVLEFFVGATLSELLRRNLFIRPACSFIMQIVAICFICLGFILDIQDYLFIPASFSMLIFSIASNKTALSRLLSNQLLVFIGKISYSTYLCHALIRELIKFSSDSFGQIQFCIYLFTVAVCSIFLYFFIEEPARIRLTKWLDLRGALK